MALFWVLLNGIGVAGIAKKKPKKKIGIGMTRISGTLLPQGVYIWKAQVFRRKKIMQSSKKLSDYVKQKEFDFGLPQGDTIIDLDSAEVEETKFTTNDGQEKQTWRITLGNGESYNVPKSVMAPIKAAVEANKKQVRVTRTGTQLATRYTVIAL